MRTRELHRGGLDQLITTALIAAVMKADLMSQAIQLQAGVRIQPRVRAQVHPVVLEQAAVVLVEEVVAAAAAVPVAEGSNSLIIF